MAVVGQGYASAPRYEITWFPDFQQPMACRVGLPNSRQTEGEIGSLKGYVGFLLQLASYEAEWKLCPGNAGNG